MLFNIIKDAVQEGTQNAIKKSLHDLTYRTKKYTEVKYGKQKVFAGYEVSLKGQFGMAKTNITGIPDKAPELTPKAVFKTIYYRRTAELTRTDKYNPITDELVKEGEPFELSVKMETQETPYENQ